MTESLNDAVSRVLEATSTEAAALRAATEASRHAAFGLLGIFVVRMQQYEERIAKLEQRLENNLPNAENVPEDWLNDFGERLWREHLEATVDGKMSEVAADVFTEMIKDVDVEADITLRARY